MLRRLEDDHRDWLLIVSYNLLLQRKADRAMTLLELLNRLDPDCPQCRKMLAYANLLSGNPTGCVQALEPIRDSSDERDAVAVRAMMALAGAGKRHSEAQGNVPRPAAA